MKITSSRFVVLTILATFSFAQEVYAVKSITATVNNVPRLHSYIDWATVYNTDTVPLVTPAPSCTDSSCPNGWEVALRDGSSASVTYKAKLTNVATGVEILDASSIPVGTQIRIDRATSTLTTDISWVGTGYSVDSPYGRWVASAGPLALACRSEDFAGSFTQAFVGATEYITSEGFDSYILLNVNPPTTSVVSPSANLSCVSNLCTVTAPGAVSVGLNFSSTNGKYYYRYYGDGEAGVGCHANNMPMRAGGNVSYNYGGFDYYGCWGYACLSSVPAYSLPIPTQTINFSLTAVGGNNAPIAPVVTPQPFTGVINVSYPFTFTATDPDNNTLRYQVDWNNDGLTDLLVPAATFVNSGTAQVASYTWTTAGVKLFKVRTEDNQGGISTWTNATATINLPIAPTVTTQPATADTATSTTLNGTGNPNGTASTGWFRYSATNPGSCNDTFGTRVPASGGVVLGSGSSAVPFNQTIGGLIPSTTYYYCAIASSTGGIAFGSVVSKLTRPSAPTGITAVPNASCGSGQINISWNTVVGATCYEIEKDGVPQCNGGSTTYSHNGLLPGSVHSYRSRANNASGPSLWSNLVTATASGACPVSDLISQNLTLSAGPYVQGQSITLNAQVRNGGGASTGISFSDNFSYQWNSTSGAWTNLPNISKPILAISGVSSDNHTFTPAQTGTLYIQHCVDSANQVNEGAGETPNCTVSAGVTVSAAPTGSISANPSNINGGATSTISWTSTNASACTVSSIEPANTDSWSGLSHLGVVTTPLYSNTTYTLVCSGILVAAASITVMSVPTLSLSSRMVEVGSSTVLTWDTSNGDEAVCTLSGGTYTDLIPSTINDPNTGSVTVVVNAMTTYTLTCPGGSDSVTVEVPPLGFET